MPNDGYTIHAIANELKREISGGKINKITQPETDELLFSIYANGSTKKLLLSCNAESARIHLTEESKTSPQVPPAFCMTLRKHLSGATIVEIEQENMDRIVKIGFECLNELHDTEKKYLIAEIMGKHSNLILLSKDDRILGSAKSVSFDVSSVRQILCGLAYTPPPKQDKLFILDGDRIQNRLLGFSGNIVKQLAQTVTGLCRVSAEEVVFEAGFPEVCPALSQTDTCRIVDTLSAFYNRAASGKEKSVLLCQDFYPFRYHSTPERFTFTDGISKAVDGFYANREKHRSFLSRAKTLRTALKGAIAKAEKKLQSTYAAIEDSKEYEREKLLGELLTSNLYRVKYGMTELIAENYYSETDERIAIPLDKALGPAQNAQRYYKRYSKQKKTFDLNTEKLPALKAHLEYLLSVDAAFSLCTEAAELEDIRSEMQAAGIIPPTSGVKRQQVKPSSPLKFDFGGYVIRVGKNNAQNDLLTKNASPEDLWLHVLKEHGSHVIVERGEHASFTDDVIRYAASLAAAYSSAKLSDKVAVDYTLKKYVKKPPKSPLGAVVYTDQKTVLVKPYEAELS